METIAAGPNTQARNNPSLLESTMIVQLQTNVRDFLVVAAGIIALLDKLVRILVENGVLKIAEQGKSAPAAVVPTHLGTEPAGKVDDYRTQQKKFVKDFLRSTF